MTQYADQHTHDVFWMGTDERNAYDEALDAIEGSGPGFGRGFFACAPKCSQLIHDVRLTQRQSRIRHHVLILKLADRGFLNLPQGAEQVDLNGHAHRSAHSIKSNAATNGTKQSRIMA